MHTPVSSYWPLTDDFMETTVFVLGTRHTAAIGRCSSALDTLRFGTLVSLQMTGEIPMDHSGRLGNTVVRHSPQGIEGGRGNEATDGERQCSSSLDTDVCSFKCARNCVRIALILDRLIDAERAKFASSSAGQQLDLQSSFRPPISYRPLSTEPKETRQEQHTFHSA